MPLESLEFTPGLIAIRQDKDRNDHTYQTGDTPNIPGHTSYVCEVVTDTFTHTHLKRESKWKESLAYSHRKECRPGGSDSCCSQGPGDNTSEDRDLHFSKQLTESERGLQASPEALLHSLHLSFLTPFLPYSYSFYSVLSPPYETRISVCVWLNFMSIPHINYILTHCKNTVPPKLSDLSQCSLRL